MIEVSILKQTSISEHILIKSSVSLGQGELMSSASKWIYGIRKARAWKKRHGGNCEDRHAPGWWTLVMIRIRSRPQQGQMSGERREGQMSCMPWFFAISSLVVVMLDDRSWKHIVRFSTALRSVDYRAFQFSLHANNKPGQQSTTNNSL